MNREKWMYLLDTNVCVSLMRNDNPHLSEWFACCDRNELFLSSIVVAELTYGVAKSRYQKQNRQALLEFYTLVPSVIDFSSADAETFGLIRAYLEEKGMPIGLLDLQIASQALDRDLTVVTHNVSEFSRIPGLKIVDWAIPQSSS